MAAAVEAYESSKRMTEECWNIAERRRREAIEARNVFVHLMSGDNSTIDAPLI